MAYSDGQQTARGIVTYTKGRFARRAGPELVVFDSVKRIELLDAVVFPPVITKEGDRQRRFQ